MRNLLFSLTLLLCSLPAVADEAAPNEDDALNNAISAVRTAFDAHEKVTAAVDMTANIPVGTKRVAMNGTGTLAYEKEGAHYVQNLQLEMPEPLKMEVKVEVLSVAGGSTWVTTEMMGKQQIKEESPEIGKGAIPPGGSLLFDMLEDDLELTLLPETAVDGKPAYAFEGRPKEDGATQYAKAEFEVDKESGLLREARLYETEGALTVTIRQHDFNFDPDLSVFNFDPPAAPTGGGAESTPPAAPTAPAAPEAPAAAETPAAPEAN